MWTNKEMKKFLKRETTMKTNCLLDNFKANVLPQIDDCLNKYLRELDSYPVLKDAMQYSVKAGGKRLRPLLILAICQILKGSYSQEDVKVASCLELIHTYSLIHDDLPEMDNDDLRRGKPTNHKVYGQAMAVLAGDGLLTLAFQLLSKVSLPSEIIVKLLYSMAKAAGPEGMVNGQVGDIQGEGAQLTLSELQHVHRGKTGALIQYACYAGSLLGNASGNQQVLLSRFGMEYGLAFQIYDDILDVIGTEEKIGKKVHKDSKKNKNTYPGLLRLDGAKCQLNESIDRMESILNLMKKDEVDPSLLLGFVDYFRIKD